MLVRRSILHRPEIKPGTDLEFGKYYKIGSDLAKLPPTAKFDSIKHELDCDFRKICAITAGFIEHSVVRVRARTVCFEKKARVIHILPHLLSKIGMHCTITPTSVIVSHAEFKKLLNHVYFMREDLKGLMAAVRLGNFRYIKTQLVPVNDQEGIILGRIVRPAKRMPYIPKERLHAKYSLWCEIPSLRGVLARYHDNYTIWELQNGNE